MQSEILKKIAEDIRINDDGCGEERIVFGKKGYDSSVINKGNFRGIEEIKDDRKIAFIDGGNSEVIGSTNFSVQLIRIYCCVFQAGKKINDVRNEFFLLAESYTKDNDVFFRTKNYPGEALADEINIDSMDKNIIEGGKRAKISKTGDIARRLAEIKAGENIIDRLKKGDVIVFDGTLECNLGDKRFLDGVYEKAAEKEVVVCALAKTANLFMDSGKNALAYINKLGGNSAWICDNFAEVNDEEHKADISVVKINKNSRHVFRFEIFKEQKREKEAVLGCLVGNCRDTGFPGYPYGLILADRYARVSNKEKEYLKSLFFSKAGGKIKQLVGELGTSDAHDILDSMN